MDNQIQQVLEHPFVAVDLPLPGKLSGKVREVFPLPADRLLLVTTDRLSAFDRILGAAPYKGQVLTSFPPGGLNAPLTSSPTICWLYPTPTPCSRRPYSPFRSK